MAVSCRLPSPEDLLFCCELKLCRICGYPRCFSLKLRKIRLSACIYVLGLCVDALVRRKKSVPLLLMLRRYMMRIFFGIPVCRFGLAFAILDGCLSCGGTSSVCLMK